VCTGTAASTAERAADSLTSGLPTSLADVAKRSTWQIGQEVEQMMVELRLMHPPGTTAAPAPACPTPQLPVRWDEMNRGLLAELRRQTDLAHMHARILVAHQQVCARIWLLTGLKELMARLHSAAEGARSGAVEGAAGYVPLLQARLRMVSRKAMVESRELVLLCEAMRELQEQARRLRGDPERERTTGHNFWSAMHAMYSEHSNGASAAAPAAFA
jgi:hypothetical protein